MINDSSKAGHKSRHIITRTFLPKADIYPETFLSQNIKSTHADFCGAATNLMTYSKENQPTKTASATSKKYSSSEM